MYFVYMLRCKDGSLYTGITTDLERRLLMHQVGKGSRYTRAKGAVSMAYSEKQPSRGAALRREAAIKKLPREKKLYLIRSGI